MECQPDPRQSQQWQYAFTNTFSEDEARRLYDHYHIPASGNIVWGGVLANVTPGHQDVWADYKNDARPPLLFISGSEDHIMPPKVQRFNAKHYQSDAITEIKEYEGVQPPDAGTGRLAGGRRFRARVGRATRRLAGSGMIGLALTHIGGPHCSSSWVAGES